MTFGELGKRMRKILSCSAALLTLSILATAGMAQDVPEKPENDLIHMPLPKGGEIYGNIDGRHLWQYVAEQAKISRDYRDGGHP